MVASFGMDDNGDGMRRGASLERSNNYEASTSGLHDDLATRSQLGVQQLLECQGVRMRPAWLASCLSGLAGIVPGFWNMPTDMQAELCFAQVLMADFTVTAAGCLPPNCHTLHKIELEGPFVLQVDEVIDVGSPLRERYKERQGGRCLKLSMTDGLQRVYGMEYRLMPEFQVLFPAGTKIAVSNVQVRRGLFLLVPEIVDVLGGVVERLEEARQRVVQVINKPPRGRRANGGRSEENPSLAEQASSAAWPMEESGVTEEVAGTTGNQQIPHGHSHMSGRPFSVTSQMVEDVGGVSRNENQRSASVDVAAARVELPRDRTGVETHLIPGPECQAHRSEGPSTVILQRVEDMSGLSRNENSQRSASGDVAAASVELPRDRNVPTATPSPSIGVRSSRLSLRRPAEVSRNEEVQRSAFCGGTAAATPELPNDRNVPRATPSPGTGVRSPPVEVISGSGTREDVVEVQMSTPINEVGACLPRSSLDPQFTYLADAMLSQNKVVAGRVKCFLVGVKEFFLTQNGCKLVVHIDDGSFITEALIKEDVVMEFLQQLHQGPSETAGGMSDNLKRLMTIENRKHLQVFLQEFEGLMDVEFQPSGEIPVVVTKMVTGFGTASTWALLNRVLEKNTRQLPVIHLLSP